MKLTAKNLTIEEKLILLTGKNSWQTDDLNGKIPSIFVADGPCGLRKLEIPADGKEENATTRYATAMPAPSSIATTWSKEMAYLDGKIIADECIDADVDILLAPGVNVKKTPLCGRNFEYFSEDPLLSGELAKSFIQGVQDKGVGTSLKHFALNNREFEKLDQSSEIDERTLREIYLPAFEKALEANPTTVMCAYNPVNGIFSSENKYLLDDILRKDFGFKGVILSDWNAVHSRYKALKATLDIQMPFNKTAFDNLKNAYENNFITIEEIDQAVDRILNLIYNCKQAKRKVEFTPEIRHQAAVEIATESMVLLKNDDDILPLKVKKVAVGGSAPVTGGTGSSKVKSAYKMDTLCELLKKEMPNTEFETFKDGIHPEFYETYIHFKSGYLKAYDNDAVILTVSNGDLCEGEGYDRLTLKLHPRIEERIINTAAINPNLIVVIYAGCALDVSCWIDKVKAVIYAGFPGEGATESLAKLISGKECFSGKLAETFPTRIEDIPDYDNYMDGFVEWYKEGIFVGYRHYDKFKKQVQFPFGHGLSYAKFSYSDLNIKKLSETDYGISYNITNESDFSAKEVSQLYVKDVFSTVIRPEKELKGFSKNLILPYQSVKITHKLSARDFAYYSTLHKEWYVENGDFEILIGASSRDIKLKGKIKINLPDQTQHSVTD